MKKATKILSVLVVLALAFVMVGCGPDSVKPTPTYLFNSSLTINSFDGIELDAKGNDVTWSIKGCDNGDDDVNNDLATYNATGLIKIENGKVIPLVGTGTARVFGTLVSDPYRYGYYDLTWDIAITDAPAVTIAASVGASDCTTAFWGAFGDIIEVPFWTSKTVTFVNHGSGANNWNAFMVVLQNVAAGHAPADDASYKEYAVVRPDNYGWGTGYATATLDSNHNWEKFIANINGATVTLKVTNKGTTADVEASWKGMTDEVAYFQKFTGITIDGPLYFSLGVDAAYLEPVAASSEGGEQGGEEPETPVTPAFAGWTMSLDNVKTALSSYGDTSNPPKLTIGDDPVVIDTAYIVYSKKEQLRLRDDGTLNYNGGTKDAFAVSTVSGTFTDTLDRYVGVDTSKFDATGNIKVTFSVLTKNSSSATGDTGVVVLFNESTKEVLAVQTGVALSAGSQSFDIEATVAAGAKVILGFSRGGAGAGGIDVTAVKAE